MRLIAHNPEEKERSIERTPIQKMPSDSALIEAMRRRQRPRSACSTTLPRPRSAASLRPASASVVRRIRGILRNLTLASTNDSLTASPAPRKVVGRNKRTEVVRRQAEAQVSSLLRMRLADAIGFAQSSHPAYHQEDPQPEKASRWSHRPRSGPSGKVLSSLGLVSDLSVGEPLTTGLLLHAVLQMQGMNATSDLEPRL
jgi:hypothetical protein